VNLIGITVSKNYAKELSICINKNYTHFSKWYIITQQDDTETIDLVNSYKHKNIELIYYPLVPDNETNPLNEDDNEFAYSPSLLKHKNKEEFEIKFDKGGAIRYVQKYLLKDDYNESCILILDSDIILPKNLKRNINYKSLKSNICYGSHRHDFLFASDLNKNKNYKKYNSKNLAGYFQLYKYDKSKLYKRSFDCSYVDYDFLNNFDDTEFLKVAVKHLGLPGVNWEGKSCDTFIDDLNNEEFKKASLEYNVNDSNRTSDEIKNVIRKRIIGMSIDNSNTKYQFPNVVIPGFRKCGSFSLKHTLSNHSNIMFPHIFTSELNYCANEKYFLSNWHNKHMWYLSHFQRDGTIWCDHSNDLLNKGSDVSINRMKTTYINKKFKYAKDVKFIVMVRNPIHRAFAEYNHCMSQFPASYTWGWEKPGKSFADNINAELEILKTKKDYIWNEEIKGRLLLNGIYEPILRKLITELNLTPKTLMVISLESLIKNPSEILNKIFNFIEAEPKNINIEKLNSYDSNRAIDKDIENKMIKFYTSYNKSYNNLFKNEYDDIYKW
jgi:hypothetical protein